MRRYSEIPPRAPRYIWEGRVPDNMLILIAGVGGGGKSLFTAHLAAEISHRGNVILSSPENLPNDSLAVEPEAYAFQRAAVTFTGEDGRTATAVLLLPQGEIEFPDPISLLLRPREEKSGSPPDKLAAASEWLIQHLYGLDGHFEE